MARKARGDASQARRAGRGAVGVTVPTVLAPRPGLMGKSTLVPPGSGRRHGGCPEFLVHVQRYLREVKDGRYIFKSRSVIFSMKALEALHAEVSWKYCRSLHCGSPPPCPETREWYPVLRPRCGFKNTEKPQMYVSIPSM